MTFPFYREGYFGIRKKNPPLSKGGCNDRGKLGNLAFPAGIRG